MSDHFTIFKRNPGHWDVTTDSGRMFRIRGERGKVLAMDERSAPYPVTEFKTTDAALIFIAGELLGDMSE